MRRRSGVYRSLDERKDSKNDKGYEGKDRIKIYFNWEWYGSSKGSIEKCWSDLWRKDCWKW